MRLIDEIYSYVSAMVPVKTMKEHEMQQDLVVLFSETVNRALALSLLSQDAVDDYDPALMFTIPRLAIVCGLLIYPDGPLNVDGDPEDMSEMFRPFQNLMYKIRDLLWTLNQCELLALEKALCSVDDSGMAWEQVEGHRQRGTYPLPNVEDYVQKLYRDYPSCKQFITDFVSFISPKDNLSPAVAAVEDSAPAPGERGNVASESAKESLTNPSSGGDNIDDVVTGGGCDGCENDEGMEQGEEKSLCSRVDSSKRNSEQESSTGGVSCGGSPWRHSSPSHGPTPAKRSREMPLARRVLRQELMNHSPSRHSVGTASANNSPSNWDSISYCSTDTSSYNSECQDDEEIALAMQAAEIASRQGVRARFKDSQDLVHRLFVCIAGVADQLQTNNASDLRNILKCVFEMNCSQPPESSNTPSSTCCTFPELLTEERVSIESAEEANERNESSTCEEAPKWIPDDLAPNCMSCETLFNLVRRRHHCRNCGKVFCGRCSSNSVPLPRFGFSKPVRVCNRCFMYQVTPFLIPTQQD